jgi:hypothetical protein
MKSYYEQLGEHQALTARVCGLSDLLRGIARRLATPGVPEVERATLTLVAERAWLKRQDAAKRNAVFTN